MIFTGEIKDPRVEPLTTVTEVKVSRDLGHAKVWVSRFGDRDGGGGQRGCPEPRGRVHPGRALQADLPADVPAAHVPPRRFNGERFPHRAEAAGHHALTEGIILLDKPPGQTSFQSLADHQAGLGTRRVGHAGHPRQVRRGAARRPCGPHDAPVPLRHCPGQGIHGRRHLRAPDRHPGPRGEDRRRGAHPVSGGSGAGSRPVHGHDLAGAAGVFGAPRRGQEGIRGCPERRRGCDCPTPGDHPQPRAASISTRPVPCSEVVCSKGTYIRSLARDIALRLESTCALCLRPAPHENRGVPRGGCRHPSKLRSSRATCFRLPGSSTAPPSMARLRLRDEWSGKAGQGLPVQDCFFEEPPRSDGTFAAFGAAAASWLRCSRSGAAVPLCGRIPAGGIDVRVVSWSDLLAGRQAFREPVRLSVGVFDGLHVGHRRLMEGITEGGRRRPCRSWSPFHAAPPRCSPLGASPASSSARPQKLGPARCLGIGGGRGD